MKHQFAFSLPILLSVMSMSAASLWAADGNPSSTLNFALINEPPNLNSMKATDQQSFFVLGHVMEGLTRYGKKDGVVNPGVAEKWKIGDKEATFNLRKNARWSDGKPVTAKDFIFGWRTALDPKTASEYAFILYPLKNAEAINQGKKPASELGVSAPDDYTLKITFEKPCGYFEGLTAFPTYFPVREDFFKTRQDKFAADATDMLYDGPYMLTKWVHGAALTLDKNPNYWNKDKIAIDRIDIPYVTADNSAQFNFFKDHKIDILERLGKDDLPKAQSERYQVKSFSDGSVFFMEFNFRDGRVTKNLNLRKAIAAVFDPEEYTTRVVGIPGTKPGRSLVPAWVKGVKDTFRKEHPVPPYKRNLADAKKYLEAAKKELGGSIPALVWLTGDTPLAAREAEYFQQVFKNDLGIDLKIDKQIFKQRLAKMTSGEFDIVSAGWGPDYADPMTFVDLKTSWNENNRGRYVNDAVDKHVRAAQSTSVAKSRMDDMAAAEKIVLDDLAILPLYERVVMYLVHDNVDGIIRHAIGPDPDFTAARIVKKSK